MAPDVHVVLARSDDQTLSQDIVTGQLDNVELGVASLSPGLFLFAEHSSLSPGSPTPTTVTAPTGNGGTRPVSVNGLSPTGMLRSCPSFTTKEDPD